MKRKLFCLLTLLLTVCSGAWAAADITYALTSFTQNPAGTFTYEFSETGWKNKEIWIEVPSASCSGTIDFKCGNTKDDRFQYIFKTAGTVKDDTRRVQMTKGYSGNPISYTSSDILNNSEKYYLVFKTSDDFKALGIKFTAPVTTYAVTYALNGGSGTTPTEEAKAEGANFTLHDGVTDITAPTGKEFDGWLCDIDKVKYAGGAQYTMTAAPTTFTAQWVTAVPKYTVTYDLNGGTGTAAQSPVAEGAVITLADAPTKDCCTFNGWLCNIDGVTYLAGADYTMTAAATTFTAQWTAAYADGASYTFENTAELGTAPNKLTMDDGSSVAVSAGSRIDNLFFGAMSITYESGVYSGEGDDFKGWKIKTSGATIKFLIEQDQMVTIGVGNLTSGINITYTATDDTEHNAEALVAKTNNVYLVKGGTVVTLTTAGSSTVTLKSIAVANITSEISAVKINGVAISSANLETLKSTHSISIDGSELNGLGMIGVTVTQGAVPTVTRTNTGNNSVFTFTYNEVDYTVTVTDVKKTYEAEDAVVYYSMNGTPATFSNENKTVTANGVEFAYSLRTFQYGEGSATLGSDVYKPLKLSTGEAVNVTFPTGKKATKIIVYGWSTNGDGWLKTLSETSSENFIFNNVVAGSADIFYATNTTTDIYPSVYEYDLSNYGGAWTSAYFHGAAPTGQPFVVMDFVFANAPIITAQPASANYEKDASTTALSVAAISSDENTVSYQWYSCTNAEKAGAVALTGETGATYTPSAAAAGVFYYYCAVTDGNGTTNTDVATIKVTSQTSSAIFSYTVTSTDVSTYDGSSAATPALTATGGTCTLNITTGDNNNKCETNNTIHVYTIGANSGYLKMTLAEGNFQKGDVVSIYGYANNADRGFYINTADAVAGLETTHFTSKNTNATVTAVIDDARAGVNELYIKRVSGGMHINSVTVTRNASATITTNAGNWASFTPEWNCTLSEGAHAYIVTGITDASVQVQEVNVLQVGEGYFIKGEAASTAYTATATNDDADDTTGNMLVGCLANTDINATTPDNYVKYVLATNNSTKATGLYYVNSNITIPAGKAYLKSNSTDMPSSAHFLSLDFEEGETTSLNEVRGLKADVRGEFYNLNGQRVAQPTKGLYIVNGRKVVIK